MDVKPLGPALGAEIRGIDLSSGVDDAAFPAILDVWLEHCLLLFRGQRLDEPALVAFSRRFGPLEAPPASERRRRGEAGSAVCPEVWIISNVVEDGEAIGSLGAGEAEWHTDMSYIEAPPSASLLYAKQVPPAGGDTHFANMYQALDDMPAPLRAEIAGRRARHDASYTSAGDLRQGAEQVADPSKASGCQHPIERTHPGSGRQALYLGRRQNGYIAGLDLAASERLLDQLWAHCTQEAFVYQHRWRPGDLLVWDNRCTIHRRDAFDSTARRIMLRTQVTGNRPN